MAPIDLPPRDSTSDPWGHPHGGASDGRRPHPAGPIPGDQLVLHYQPLVAMAGRTLYAVEALARWQHPSLGLLEPKRFIARAAASGALVPMTALVLQKAIERQTTWRRAGVRLAMSVNVSALFLAGADAADAILAMLARHGAAPEDLTVEITETEASQNPALAREQLQVLSDAGIGIAMDDFGQGESTPERLAYFPFSNLKLDRSLVSGAGRTPQGFRLLRAAMALARARGVSITAEGIETPAHWQRLEDEGCDYAQGYLVSPPRPEDELMSWIDDVLKAGRYVRRGETNES